MTGPTEETAPGMPHRARRSAAMVALGAWLAVSGSAGALGLAFASTSAVAASVLLYALPHQGTQASARLLAAASRATTWSAGLAIAFGASLHALQRDRAQGVRALVRARGVNLTQYVVGRVGGLVIVLFVAVGSAMLMAGLAATAAGGGWPAVGSCAAAVVYVAAFAAVLGPVAMATLAGRTRAGSYVTLLAVVVLPELVSPWTSRLLPSGWHELTSIPAALEALRPGSDGPLESAAIAARALAGLTAVVAVSFIVLRIRVATADPEGRS